MKAKPRATAAKRGYGPSILLARGKAGFRPLTVSGLGCKRRMTSMRENAYWIDYSCWIDYMRIMVTIWTDKESLDNAVKAKRKMGSWTSGVESLRSGSPKIGERIESESSPKVAKEAK